MFKDVGRIKISGGCEVYAEGTITFVPMGRDITTVRLDNSGGYFYTEDHDPDPVPSFGVKVFTKQLSEFIKRWMKMMASVHREKEYFNTRNATVLFDFTFEDKKVHYHYAENQGGYQLDSIMASIEAFVIRCHQKTTPPKSSVPPFSPKNDTETFLGDLKERKKAMIHYNDMNGMHGGSIIVVNGMGNAMVQIVTPENAQQKMWEQRYAFDLSHAQLDEIWTQLIQNDVMTIQLADRPGAPDETRIHVSLTNGSDDLLRLETWAQASLPPDSYPKSSRARFDKACLALKRLAHLARTEKKPVKEGPYDHP